MKSTSFDLQRSFAIASLLSIAAVTAVTSFFLLRFLSDHLLKRDASVTQEFIQSVAQTEDPEISFLRPNLLADKEGLAELFVHIAHMPDVIRANVYASNRMIVWSDDPERIGQRFSDNDELERALSGELVFEVTQRYKMNEGGKAEHSDLPEEAEEFVENYIPIWNLDRSEVVGVAEVYKIPTALSRSLRQGELIVWASAAGGGAFLFATLFWIVRRASLVMARQQRQLLESEALATVGEMASAVAHGLRNPLASIRSSVELALSGDPPEIEPEIGQDIVVEVDRMGQLIRELLVFSRADTDHAEPIDVGEVIGETLESLSSLTARNGIRVNSQFNGRLPHILGDASLLSQLFHNIVTNAIDAMEPDGLLVVRVGPEDGQRQVRVDVSDSGKGMSHEELAMVVKPFYTGKRGGLGLGLPLAKRIAERHGGTFELASRPGEGTTISLVFPAAGAGR
jgi:signal transduction histidine kinase